MLSKKFLWKSLNNFSLLLATNLLLGAFLNLPSLAMLPDDQEESLFHPFKIADATNIIIRGNPKSFAGVSRDYHAYVCQKGFMMMYIGTHKVDKYRYRLKAYGAESAKRDIPKGYQWTEEKELSLLQSLDKRQISNKDDYSLPLPPIRVSDYHTDVVINLLNKPEIPIRALELWHTFNTHVTGTDFFYAHGAGSLSKSTIVQLIASSRREEIKREVGDQALSQEQQKVLFETKISPLYPTEREKYIKSDVLKKTILLLESIKNNKTLQTLKVCCDGLDLIEDELLETLGKNSNLTSLSINPTQVPPFWQGENKLIDYLTTNKTLKNLALKNISLSWLTPEQFDTLRNISILTSMSINAESDLFDSRKMAMIQNCLLNTKTLKKFTLKELYHDKAEEEKENFMTTCTAICKPKDIRLKILDYHHNIILGEK